MEKSHSKSHILPFFRNLREEDKIFPAGALGNYSLAGFEMVKMTHPLLLFYTLFYLFLLSSTLV